MTTLTAARVVTPHALIEPGVVEVEDGRVVVVASTRGPVPHRTLVPGYVDLQVNGIDDIDVASASGRDWDRLGELLLAQGVTAWCPTLLTSPLHAYAGALARIAEARARPGPRPLIVGAHLEGPFLGTMAGAHRSELVRELDVAWLEALPDVVRLVTLGPEQLGAPAAVRAMTAKGIVVALGHSAASIDEIDAAVAAGACLVTHLFNAMPSLRPREPGLVGAALSDDRLTVALIADLVHVHPRTLALAFRAKGPGRVVLVTDAVAWRARRTGGVRVHVDGPAVRLDDGALAGTTLGMDRAVANVAELAGVSLSDAVHAASTTPATLIGIGDRGRLEAGAVADVVALDDDLRAVDVWLAGDRVR